MSNHVLKPVLIGLFVLVVLIAAVALVFSTAPQASEITSSTASPRTTTATTSTGSYYAPVPGTVECSDGEDNDGDGLIDWSATADTSTVDLECDSARDRSERYIGAQ